MCIITLPRVALLRDALVALTLPKRERPMKQNLTDRTLKALRPARGGRRYEVMDGLVPGLGVRVSGSGKLTFILVTRYPGSNNPTRGTLGRYGKLTLQAARDKARDWLERLQKGVDPRATPQSAPPQKPNEEPQEQAGPAAKFGDVVETYIATQVEGKMRGAYEVKRALRVEFVNDRATGGKTRKGLGPRAIGTVRRADIEKVIDDAVERGARTGAHGYLAIVRSFFNWAIDSGKYGLETSPCDRLKPKRVIGVKNKRDRFHSDRELTVIWAAAGRLGYPYGPLIRLLILLGKRKGEVARAQWSEFDFENKWWQIPGSRTKNGIADIVPLTDNDIAILKSLPTFAGERKGAYIFSSVFGLKPVNGFSKARKRLDEEIREELAKKAAGSGPDGCWPAELPEWVLHDFRRTIRTNLPRLGVLREIAELVIGHKKPGIQGVYDIFEYLDEKRDALERWESHLAGLGLDLRSDAWRYGRTPSLARMKAAGAAGSAAA